MAKLILLLTAILFSVAFSMNGRRLGGGRGGGSGRRGVPFLTGETGHRTGSNQDSQTIGDNGPILLQDVYPLVKLRRFNSERIPERVVHAHGSGVFGEFTSTVNLKKYTQAKFLQGGKTEIFVRFSTVEGSKGSPETVRDPRGFSIKFYSEKDGTFDMVGNNLPVFFIRDHLKFPDLVHAVKPDPITNRGDPNRLFDFFSAIGGTATHMLTYLFSDLGIPKSFRFMDGNSVHAYKFVNKAGKVTYFKMRWTPQQGIQNLTVAEAAEIQSMDVGHATRDLFDSIKSANFPKWDVKVQLVTPEQLATFEFDPLDATKEWPQDKFPFQKIGEFVLNRIPDNFYQFSEQVAYSPGNYLPGSIEPSEDSLLQGRIISYHESQEHRLGSGNFVHLPVNKARAPINNYNQDGAMNFFNAWSGSVNYEPSNDPNVFREDPRFLLSRMRFCALTQQKPILRPFNFFQAGELYQRFDVQQRANLVSNLAGPLSAVANARVRCTIAAHMYLADKEYGTEVAAAVNCPMNFVKKILSSIQK